MLPLRKRKEEIPVLVEYFTGKLRPGCKISKNAMNLLMGYAGQASRGQAAFSGEPQGLSILQDRPRARARYISAAAMISPNSRMR